MIVHSNFNSNFPKFKPIMAGKHRVKTGKKATIDLKKLS